MTNEITTANTAITTGAVLTQELFADFVGYIDRTARTAKAYITNLRQFWCWLRYSYISAPVRADVVAYRDWLASEHDAIVLDGSPEGWRYVVGKDGNKQQVQCKPATVKAYLQSVKAFFGWTGSNGLYPDIAKNVHAPQIAKGHKKDALTAEQVQAIEASISLQAEKRASEAAHAAKDVEGRTVRTTEQGARLQAMYLLAVNTGLRTVEISRANVRDLEYKGGQAWLYIWGKGHSEADRKKALAAEVYAAIKAYLALRTDTTGSAPLFTSTGNRSGGKRIAETTISKMLKSAMRDAGFDSDRITAHSLRHTAGQNVMELTGNNIYITQQFMRHEKPETTEIYLDNNNAQQDASIAQQLYDHYHGTAGKASSAADKLQAAAARLTPDKLEQLAAIAAALA